MDILILMILLSITIELLFLIIFIISCIKGQYDNIESNSIRILFDD